MGLRPTYWHENWFESVLYPHGAWTAQVGLRSGWSEAVFEFDRERTIWTNLCRATFRV